MPAYYRSLRLEQLDADIRGIQEKGVSSKSKKSPRFPSDLPAVKEDREYTHDGL
jgi:hypothetical protein